MNLSSPQRLGLLGAAIAIGMMIPAKSIAEEVRLAYLIGLGNYQKGLSKGTFKDMSAPILNDIEKMGSALLKIGFATQDITVLSDIEDAPVGTPLRYRKPLTSRDAPNTAIALSHFTRAVSDALLELEEQQARGLVVFYFSGHGGMIASERAGEKDGERVIAFPDSHSDDPESFGKVYELLERLAQRAPDVHKVLIIDACASKLKAKPTTRSQSRNAEALPVHFFSSRLGQPSFIEPATQSSLFTTVLADALEHADDLGEGNADGTVDAEEIRAYIRRHFPAKTVELKRSQGLIEKGVAQMPIMMPTENLVLGQLGRTGKVVSENQYGQLEK